MHMGGAGAVAFPWAGGPTGNGTAAFGLFMAATPTTEA